MAENKSGSSTHERKIYAYLRPSLYNKFNAYVVTNKLGKSEAINEAVRLLVSNQQNNPPKKP